MILGSGNQWMWSLADPSSGKVSTCVMQPNCHMFLFGNFSVYVLYFTIEKPLKMRDSMKTPLFKKCKKCVSDRSIKGISLKEKMLLSICKIFFSLFLFAYKNQIIVPIFPLLKYLWPPTPTKKG